MDVISTILNQLNEWRHLPAYQLERRVDVLFGMFLPTVIGMKFDVNPDNCSVIPEFPLHKGKLGLSNNNQSMNGVACGGLSRDRNRDRRHTLSVHGRLQRAVALRRPVLECPPADIDTGCASHDR